MPRGKLIEHGKKGKNLWTRDREACDKLKELLKELSGKKVTEVDCYSRKPYESIAKFNVDLRKVDLDDMMNKMDGALEGFESYQDIFLLNDTDIEEMDQHELKNAPVWLDITWWSQC